MEITIQLPDEIATQLQVGDFSRRILELIVADRYRQGQLGAAQVRRILNFSSRWETYQFLKEEKAYLPYSEADLDQDRKILDNLFGKAVK